MRRERTGSGMLNVCVCFEGRGGGALEDGSQYIACRWHRCYSLIEAGAKVMFEPYVLHRELPGLRSTMDSKKLFVMEGRALSCW